MIWEDVMKRNGEGRERSSELKTQKGVMRTSGKRDICWIRFMELGHTTSNDLRN